MEFVGVARVGPLFVANTCDGVRIERAEISGAGGIGRPPGLNRVAPAFLERRIVQEGVRFGVQDFVGEERGLGSVAGDQADARRDGFARARARSPSKSIASSRQSRTVWLTSG